MNIKEEAKKFAIEAHMGQVRKNEPDKPMIMHPINTGNILKQYGFDDNVIAAGYLHDVVEDTSYSIEDIRELFGDDIANLVLGNTEPDKSLSWEDRKKHTISNVKNLSLREKAIVCADKISNLEDLSLIFRKSGKRDFSRFNRGEEQQKWYYNSIYESLIFNEDKNFPMFLRYKELVDSLFNYSDSKNFKDKIFSNDLDYYDKLKMLHACKEELFKLKSLCNMSHPFIIEFTGTPRTGKTSIIHNLSDFFKKGGFSVDVIEEFTTSSYYKNELKNSYSNLSRGERNIQIVEEVFRQLLLAHGSHNDIVLIDRSLNDRQIWNYNCFLDGAIDSELFDKLKRKYSTLSREMIDFLVATYADSFVSLKRDYVNSLALEDRSFLNINNIDSYNSSLNELHELFEKSVDSYLFVDTINMSVRDTSLVVCDNVMKSMRKKYIKQFKIDNDIK